MKNNFWNKIWNGIKDLFIVIGSLIAIPFLILYLIIRSLICLIYAPFEYAKYKKSNYYKTYNHKYFIDITSTDKFHLCSKLLENGIILQQIDMRKYGYWCLTNENHLFAIFPDYHEIYINGRDYENPIIENRGYQDDGATMLEFIAEIEKELEINLGSRPVKLTIFLYAKHIDPELKYILNNNDIFTYDKIDRLAKTILDKVQI